MLIVVTGFGLFRGYDVNPSWEAVKALPAAWDDEQHEVVVEEIPVQYDFVLQEVPHRWSSRQPDFIIHVGVSHLAEKLTLERQANNTGYNNPDVTGVCPPGNCCVSSASGEQAKLASCLDLEELSEKVTEQCKEVGLEAVVSEDAGRYLCDFVYYKTLHATQGKSLFVHVPLVDKPYSLPQMTEGLKAVTKNVIEQLRRRSVP